jgi:hypothetical protein
MVHLSLMGYYETAVSFFMVWNVGKTPPDVNVKLAR